MEDDILLWPDGFWCFRGEITPAFLRDCSYRVVGQLTEEWLGLTNAEIKQQF